jgi:hypothetical protein
MNTADLDLANICRTFQLKSGKDGAEPEVLIFDQFEEFLP